MDEIARLRARIDEIDQDLLGLLKRRYENARELGLLKHTRERNIRDARREKTVLQRVQTTARSLGLNPRRVANIFNQIFRLSIEAQSRPTSLASDLGGKNVLVVGGSGRMGRLLARFTRTYGATVKIMGRDPRKSGRAARELAVEPGSIKDAAISDIVIVAVPIGATKQVSAHVASHMRAGTLLTDLSSVKSGVADEIFSKIPERIEYVSIHPLFGPDIDSLAGQSIAAVSYRTGPQWRSFSRAIRHSGGRVHFLTTEAHDKTMALVQVLHHFSLICLTRSLEDWDGELGTNSMKRTLGTVQKLLKNWDTVASIQRLNPYAKNTRLEFAGIVQSLVDWPPGLREAGDLSAHVQKWSRKL